jgi:hypothetical protein
VSSIVEVSLQQSLVIVINILGLTPCIYFGKKLMQKYADDPDYKKYG